MNYQVIDQAYLTGERALFMAQQKDIRHTTFADGESPLKESRDIRLLGSLFKWKYPLWYAKHIDAKDCVLFDTARAGIWYTEDIAMTDCVIEAPKTFRRSKDIRLTNIAMPNAQETLWSCDGVRMENVTARGDYFGMNSSRLDITNLTMDGNYTFDGCTDVTIRSSRFVTKDAFWNCRHVAVYDSFISGEYIGWNAEDVYFENCTIESLQGFCYMKNVTLRNCRLLNTTLAFEYATVDADIVGKVDSVKNPISGRITSDGIAELIFDDQQIDPKNTTITTRGEHT